MSSQKFIYIVKLFTETVWVVDREDKFLSVIWHDEPMDSIPCKFNIIHKT